MYSNELVIKLINYIDNNINKKITIDELSKTFCFNKDYLMRIFKKELNITIIDYINRRRVYNSLEELKTTDDMIIKVALTNGFTSIEYFSETFTKIMGVSPMTYRKFTKINSQISDDELKKIRQSLAEISNCLKKIDFYMLNIPTKEVKTLSFFK